MALLEKIAGSLDDNGEHCKIPPCHFWATVWEIAVGEITEAQAANYWGSQMGGAWDADDTTDLAWLVGKVPANINQRILWMIGLQAILYAVELEAPGYTDITDIVARINRL